MSHVAGCRYHGKPGARWYGPDELWDCTCPLDPFVDRDGATAGPDDSAVSASARDRAIRDCAQLVRDYAHDTHPRHGTREACARCDITAVLLYVSKRLLDLAVSADADSTADDGERRQCPAHGPLDESGGCAGCVADDRATDAWEGN